MAKQVGPHAFERKGPHAPQWYVVDAKDQVVGRIATVLASMITGKHKPTYTPHADTGDFIVVINADKVVFTRNKLDDKIYHKHTQHVGGVKSVTAREMLERRPERVLKKAVWGMIHKTSLGRRQLDKLKIYAGDKHPHAAQKPKPLPEHIVKRSNLGDKKNAEAS